MLRKRALIVSPAVLAFIALLPATTAAQTGTVGGPVKDDTGAAAPGFVLENQVGITQDQIAAAQNLQRQRNTELLKTLPVARRRRVVTGHNAQGKPYVVSDELIEGTVQMGLWETDASQPLGPGPSSEIVGSEHLLPKKGSTRAYFATLPAGFNSAATLENRIGMHRTLTIDYVYVLSGEVTMLIDIPGEVRLKAGDIVIQRNTDHSWRVDGKTPVTLLAFLARIEK